MRTGFRNSNKISTNAIGELWTDGVLRITEHLNRTVESPILRVVYVVVSSENDIYLEQSYISALSLKRHNKRTEIIFITDNETYSNLRGWRLEEFDVADRVIEVNLNPKNGPLLRSRILKTTLPLYISSEFLFIDSDTLILRNIEDIETLEIHEIGCVLDLHVPFQSNPDKDVTIQKGNGFFDYEDVESYYNSGVIWVKSNNRTRAFFEAWHSNYLEGAKRGIFLDQPSLAVTSKDYDIVSALSPEWNCQAGFGLTYYSRAKIFHYFSSIPQLRIFELANRELLLSYRASEGISAIIENIILDFHNGFSPQLRIQKWESIPCTKNAMYSFISKNYNKKWFWIFDRLGALLNHLV